MVLARLHLGGSEGPPQLVTVSVKVPATPPVALVGAIEAMNCLTELGGFAPLTLGAMTRADITSRATAAITSLPRLESNGLRTDMWSPSDSGVEKR
jgi:hypothetical protein